MHINLNMSTKLGSMSIENSKITETQKKAVERMKEVREQEKLIAKEVASKRRQSLQATNSKKEKELLMTEYQELQNEIARTRQQIELVQLNQGKAQKDAEAAEEMRKQSETLKIETLKRNQQIAREREIHAETELKKAKIEMSNKAEEIHQIKKKKQIFEDLSKIARDKAKTFQKTQAEKKPVEIEINRVDDDRDKKSTAQAYANTYYHNTMIMKHGEPEKPASQKAEEEIAKQENTMKETLSKIASQQLASKRRGFNAMQAIKDSREKNEIIEELEKLDKADKKLHMVDHTTAYMHTTLEINEKRKQEIMEREFEKAAGITEIDDNQYNKDETEMHPSKELLNIPNPVITCKIDDGKSPYMSSQKDSENKENISQQQSSNISPQPSNPLQNSALNKQNEPSSNENIWQPNKVKPQELTHSIPISISSSNKKNLEIPESDEKDLHSPCDSNISAKPESIAHVTHTSKPPQKQPSNDEENLPINQDFTKTGMQNELLNQENNPSTDYPANNDEAEVDMQNYNEGKNSPSFNPALPLNPIKEETGSECSLGDSNSNPKGSTAPHIGAPQNALPQMNQYMKEESSESRSPPEERHRQSPAANPITVGTEEIDAFIQESKKFLQERMAANTVSPSAVSDQSNLISSAKAQPRDGKSLLSEFLENSDEKRENKKNSPEPQKMEEKKVVDEKPNGIESHASNRPPTDYNYSPSSEEKSQNIGEYLTEQTENKPVLMTFNMGSKEKPSEAPSLASKTQDNTRKERHEKTKEELIEYRKQMMKSKKKASTKVEEKEEEKKDDTSKAKTDLMRRLATGEKAKVSKEDMHKLTQKNYQMLPEIQEKLAHEKKKEELKERMRAVKELEKKRRQDMLTKINM